jgi:hypothetical protein
MKCRIWTFPEAGLLVSIKDISMKYIAIQPLVARVNGDGLAGIRYF